MPSSFVASYEFLAVICKALHLDPSVVNRIVLDIDARGMVQVYVTQYGSADLLKIDWTGNLKPTEISVTSKPDGEQI